MKVSRNRIKNSIIINKSIEGIHCLRCDGRNVINGICSDCHNDGSPLYYTDREIKNKNHIVKMRFELSPRQQKASHYFLELLKKKESGVLYAVCGSGKTEIMYESILFALNNHMKACFAIPRKEIVKELSERLKKVFIKTTISALYENSHNDEGELIVSTVHQLINYDNEFDLIILDEADAFPFYKNEYLNRILRRALKKSGSLFMMSATLSDFSSNNILIISRRYHNEILDKPSLIIDKKFSLDNLDSLNKIIDNTDRKIIIYTKSIKDSTRLSRILNVPSVNSKKEIKETLNSFRKSKDRIIVSTTILERGVTFSNLDVIVINAENEVFNKETLIQICGRVGRTMNDRHGNIYFISKEKMIKFYLVNKYIEKMNKYEM